MNRDWKCLAFSSFFLTCICATWVIANPNTQKFSVPLFGEAELPCEIENAANESMVWKFDGYVHTDITISSGRKILIPFGNNYFSVAKNHRLRVKNFSLDMIGNYTCEIPFKNVAVKYDIRLEDQPPKLLEVTEGDNFTLPCHPALQNSSQVPDEGDFEWVIPNDVPIYSNGRLSPFLSVLDGNNNSLFAIDNSALIVHHTPYWENLNLTCRLPRLHTNFTYVFKIRQNHKFTRMTVRFQISPRKYKGPVVLDCMDLKSPEGTTMWVRRRIKENATFIKVISLNERILVQNNSADFRIAENKSLIISNFKWTPKTDYKCYWSTEFTVYEHRTYGTHIIGPNAQGRDDDNDDDKDNEDRRDILIKPTILIAVNPTDKNLVLTCPVGVGNHNEYEWIVKKWDEDFPDVFILNGVNFRSECRHECYKVNNDGSLIIPTLYTVVNSTYTCRNRISGEVLAYNVALRTEVKPIKSILVEQGGNVTLPCQTSHLGDRHLNAIEWEIELKDAASKWPIILNIMEGKVLSPLFSFYEPVPRNMTIAGDKQSLIVTDFHSGLIGNYSCFWAYSGTRQTYTLELKSNSTYL